MRYPNGQPIRISDTVEDLTGTLVNATTITLTVQKPDGTQQIYSSPTNDSTGKYHQDIPAADLAQNGHYLFVWTKTGTGAGVSTGEFEVYDPFEPVVLSLQDAKDALNIAQTTTTYDSEIHVYLDTVNTAMETIVGGPIVNRTVTNERVRQTYYNPRLVLRQRIVQSVTSIVDEWTGAAMDTSQVVVDQVSNVISRKGELPFLFRGPWCLVTYVAGQGTSVPPAFNAAARIIMQHLWSTQRGPGLAPVPNMESTFLPGMSYAIPNRALEIMRPYALEVYV